MKQLSPMDSAFLGLESETMTGNLGTVMILDPSGLDRPFDTEYVKALISERLPRFEVFHRRLRNVPFGIDRPYWVDDDRFDLDYHVRESALPAPGDMDQLMTLVARIHERPLDQTRPMWEVYIINGLADGRIAIYTKTHHVVVDGVSGMQLLTALTDTDPDARPGDPAHVDVEKPPSEINLLARAVGSLASRPGDAVTIARSFIAWSPKLVSDTGWNLRRGTKAARQEEVEHAVGLPLRTPPTPFNTKIGRHRRFGVADLPLSTIKEIKGILGGSVNDVVMAVTAAALRRWLEEHDLPTDQPLVCLVPVAVKDADRSQQGNYVTAMLTTLPVHLEATLDRMRSSSTFTRSAKKKGAAIPPDALIGAMKFAPPILFGRAARAVWEQGVFRAIRPFNLVISNVPGGSEQSYVAGAAIEAMYPVSVVADGMGVNVALMGYRDNLHVGITVCREAVPDVQQIADWMREEIDVLLEAAREKSAS